MPEYRVIVKRSDFLEFRLKAKNLGRANESTEIGQYGKFIGKLHPGQPDEEVISIKMIKEQDDA